MNDSGDVLSAVWREACRHIEIEESIEAIAAVLAVHLPLRGIAVLRPSPADHVVETIAAGETGGSRAIAARTEKLPPSVWQRLTQWLHGGPLVRLEDGGEDGDDDWLRSGLPAGLDGCLLVGPLRCQHAPAGFVVFSSEATSRFTAAHEAVARQLLEPLQVAVENGARLHELRTLREAAEADRRTLLSRLGRQDINEEVIGARTGLRHVMERVELVTASDVPVLILGETGTGKEVVSRAIHTRSGRADGPFIRVNCGAIPPELIDSQLFGHEKGAFTGASDQHHGWFERADGGTLFLDEIGELPLPAQVRLLRVLQDHQIERVGGRSAVHVDVRIVAATHRDLAAMVKEKTFREDLWYRINVFPIRLPTLRERLEDIPALVGHFARRAATRFGLPAVEPSPTDLRLLATYDWPGNIRELGAVIDRAAILGGGRSLDVATALGLGLSPGKQEPGAAPRATPAATDADASGTQEPDHGPAAAAGPIQPLAAAMRRHIERALAATRGRIEGPRGAAAILEINPHTLRARMRKLGVEATRFRE
ncbi:MAG: sigma-54 interaction domain-containing protein [Planctomycetaceae bacterium]